jgi:hypothetical protein
VAAGQPSGKKPAQPSSESASGKKRSMQEGATGGAPTKIKVRRRSQPDFSKSRARKPLAPHASPRCSQEKGGKHQAAGRVPSGEERSPGGPAGVLNSYQPGTEKCYWEAAAAGGNSADLVSQRQLQLLAALYEKNRNGSSQKQRRPK